MCRVEREWKGQKMVGKRKLCAFFHCYYLWVFIVCMFEGVWRLLKLPLFFLFLLPRSLANENSMRRSATEIQMNRGKKEKKIEREREGEKMGSGKSKMEKVVNRSYIFCEKLCVYLWNIHRQKYIDLYNAKVAVDENPSWLDP